MQSYLSLFLVYWSPINLLADNYQPFGLQLSTVWLMVINQTVDNHQHQISIKRKSD